MRNLVDRSPALATSQALRTGIPRATPYADQVGFGFASFLLGDVESASSRVPFSLYGRRKFYTLWAQDDFKVNRKLTLTMDLRWEATGPLTEKFGHWANFEYTKMNTALGIPGALEFAGNGSTSFMKNRDWKEFSPHVGVAFQLTPRSVLRASYGIFYSPLGLNFHNGVPYGFAPAIKGPTNGIGRRTFLRPSTGATATPTISSRARSIRTSSNTPWYESTPIRLKLVTFNNGTLAWNLRWAGTCG